MINNGPLHLLLFFFFPLSFFLSLTHSFHLAIRTPARYIPAIIAADKYTIYREHENIACPALSRSLCFSLQFSSPTRSLRFSFFFSSSFLFFFFHQIAIAAQSKRSAHARADENTDFQGRRVSFRNQLPKSETLARGKCETLSRKVYERIETRRCLRYAILTSDRAYSECAIRRCLIHCPIMCFLASYDK